MKKELKYLHIYDDDKITEASVQLFLRMEDPNHSFVVLSTNKSKWESYVKGNSNFQVFSPDGPFNDKLNQEIQKYHVIFFHPLSFVKAKILSDYRTKNQVFVWVLWGYDLYNIADHFDKNNNYRTTIKTTGIKAKIRDFYTYKIIYKKAIQKIDMCYFLLEEDFNILSSIMKHKAIWQSNIYPTLEYYTQHLSDFSLIGNSILVGNSSTPSNRHEFAFSKLKKLVLADRRIVCPLNYGDIDYGEQIQKLGQQTFGDSFDPLIDFMNLEDYMTKIRSCSHAVMPHLRQQAFGTIVILLYFGCKVFLSNSSPIYKWLKSNGIKVYTAEKDLEKEIGSPLNSDEVNKNRRLLENLLSEETFRKNQKIIMDKCYSLWSKKNNFASI